MASPFIQSIRDHLRARQYSKRTEQTYIYWIADYIRFHKMRHPSQLNEADIVTYLEHLALHRNVTPSTQKTALNALMYLYRKVFGNNDIDIGEFKQATRPRKLPVVLNRSEVRSLLQQLSGQYRLCAELMYGSGLRVMEVCRLRVKDIDLERLAIVVREAKGNKQRITTLAESCVVQLQRQLQQVALFWEEDQAEPDWRGVYLPFALERKYPNAPTELAWQYLFPAPHRSCDARSGKVRRHHLYEQNLQRVVKRAVNNCGINKQASCHTLRHNAEFRIIPSSKQKQGESRHLMYIELGIIRDYSGRPIADRQAGNAPLASLWASSLPRPFL